MARSLIQYLVILSLSIFASCVSAQEMPGRVLKTLDTGLNGMAEYMRNGGWGTAWSLDEKVVWGEFLPIPEDWITIQSPATPIAAGVYLRAGQVLSDKRWIDVAKQAHETLCKIQSSDGGFSHEGPPGDGPSKHASFDDGVTTDTLNFFIDWWHHTGAAEDRAAVDRIGAFILTSQYATTGGWPQSYPPPSGYGRCITFNDGNFSNIIKALYKLARETGDERYREAARRGGECILRLQGVGEESIWAQQYDPDTLEPAWARKFEPPGYSPAESSAVCDTLVEMFVETEDERYVDALGRALTWYEGHKLENGKYARLYEPGTQRPVYGRRDKAEKVYDFANACEGYGWQGSWYPKNAKLAYDSIRSHGKSAFLERYRADRNRITVSKPSEKTIAGICERLSDQGHWIRRPSSKQLVYYEKNGVDPAVPMVLIRDFNTHITQLLDYVEATQ
jgi:PelA/Pel-15E family pectate lyase